MSDPTEALLRALVEVSVKLGEANELARDHRIELTELRNWVNEQMTIQFGDLSERVGKLESAASARRGGWKTITLIGATITGLTAIATAVTELIRGKPH
jgi:hypothetical protein